MSICTSRQRTFSKGYFHKCKERLYPTCLHNKRSEAGVLFQKPDLMAASYKKNVLASVI